MGLYRCYLCNNPKGLEFESSEPICPSCKASAPAVVQLTAVHFLFPEKDGPIVGLHGLKFRVACKPETKALRGVPATGESGPVTCPRCKATAQYQERAKVDDYMANGGLTLEGECC